MTQIDATAAIQVKDVRNLKIEATALHILLDLVRFAFIDFSGLGAIVTPMKQLGADRRLNLAGLSETVGKVLKFTWIDTVFTTNLSIVEAIRDVGT